jgi:hypothetical protein
MSAHKAGAHVLLRSTQLCHLVLLSVLLYRVERWVFSLKGYWMRYSRVLKISDCLRKSFNSSELAALETNLSQVSPLSEVNWLKSYRIARLYTI